MKSSSVDKEKVREVKKMVDQGIAFSEAEIVPMRTQIQKLEGTIEKTKNTIQADKKSAKELEKLLTAKK